MTPAIEASDMSSDATARKLLATISSLPEGSRKRFKRLAPARPICTPRGSLAIAPGVFELMPRPVSFARPTTDSSSPIGSSCSPLSCLSPIRPAAWPAEGSLLLDHLPFRVRALDASGKRIPAGRVAFDVFCAVGYHAGKPRIWHAQAFPSAHPAHWSAFLGSLPGEPKRIVCDAHGGMLRAIEERLARHGAIPMRMASAARP
jgi:hypothetical protein